MGRWIVDTTAHFDEWLEEQDTDMIEDVLAGLKVLEHFGPMLGRPEVDHIRGSTISNMKELRVQSNGRPVRAFFVFDPKRQAIVLCAGDKTGLKEKRFYADMIKTAEEEYRKHLEAMKIADVKRHYPESVK
ncbi:diaminopimelate decarboxylase [Chimaeribacter arupi]|uniref:Type II toxin-antitoxin system RelE/ParE family toxin n=1 Tax=Nissabacter archeti TaxID=1917880 RepID=A0ABS5JH59_9GAMM|nr:MULTISPECIES: type II toxin-antitoxin system RelE/ParE family toxin [Yersiniaceae]MBS0969314.1 type II toxin-antitoxin system RelE/ParE family toxin [Nissabacter archeti]PLR42419.1 diaminopimelate decarboxylase [Chimaeribacter arupi]PLR44507.1 diaminopimelate decarboxylase [Chimaeribacter arupi]WKZ94751.1 type II toxin-antitoxin system RelE/ParE family toxin [Chimaeribacter arupi]